MSGRPVRGIVGLVTVLACLVSGAGVAGARSTTSVPSPSASGTPAPTFGTVPVPVYGHLRLRTGLGIEGDPFHVLIHGVRRIDDATVLYFSVGEPAGGRQSEFSSQPFGLAMGLQGISLRDTPACSCYEGMRLLDVTHRRIYASAMDPNGKNLASGADGNREVFGDESGRFYVYWNVFPALPADVTSVQVMNGGGHVVASVPVQDGLMTPTRPIDGPVELGSGWPAVPADIAKQSVEPERSIRTFELANANADGSVGVRVGETKQSVDLAADVLFAVDSAKLSAQAGARLKQAAADINAKAAGGTVTVVGHTDNTASDAYNDKLSRTRAKAVLAELKPLITASGLKFTASGRGERDPVGDNDTKAGRAANRRVTITFETKG